MAGYFLISGWLPFLIFLAVVSSTAVPFSASVQQEEELEDWETRRLAGARQNPLLREYFQEQYRFFNTTPGVEPNRRFREEYIDRRIDHFLEEIEEKLEIIHQLYDRASQHRSNALGRGIPEQEKTLAIQGLETTLDELKGKTDSLRDQLALVFRGLDHKRDLEEAEQVGDPAAPLYGTEMAFIGDQLDKADTRIREYLFLSLNTVRWDHLQDQNMLVNLYWAQKMAEHTLEQLRESR